MKLHNGWRNLVQRLASVGLTVRLRPARVRISKRSRPPRGHNGRNRRSIMGTNILSGMLIALSVYFLGRTVLPDLVIDFFLNLLFSLKFYLLNVAFTPPNMTAVVISLLIVVTIAAGVCSYIISIGKIVTLNLLLVGGIVAINVLAPVQVPIPLSSIFVVVLMTMGALLDYYLDTRQQQRRSQLVADRQRMGFVILRHITHSVNPTIRTALSPLLAVKEHLKGTGSLGDIIARRRDGSDERIEDALDAAVLSLHQIRDILDTSEDLFADRIEKRDFVDVDLDELFEGEIFPLFAQARFSIKTDFAGVGSVRLHRPSFIQAIKNLLRNADLHAFPEGFNRQEGLEVNFSARRRAKDIVIDYSNNGVPFPSGFRTGDFLTFGRKGKNSKGKGLGGAWVGKFVEAHHGAFRKISNDPVHFRIILPLRSRR